MARRCCTAAGLPGSVRQDLARTPGFCPSALPGWHGDISAPYCPPLPPQVSLVVGYGKQHFSDPVAPSHRLFLGSVGRERRAGKMPAPAPPGWEMLQGLQSVRLLWGGRCVMCTSMHLYLYAYMHISLCLYFHTHLCVCPLQAYSCASSHACQHVCAHMHTPCMWTPCTPCRSTCRSTFSFCRRGPTRERAQRGSPGCAPFGDLWPWLSPDASAAWPRGSTVAHCYGVHGNAVSRIIITLMKN